VQSGGLDLVIVPGVAFTRGGCRLGHGKAYYDRYLHRVALLAESRLSIAFNVVSLTESRPPPYVLGLSFSQQEIEDIPMDEHDVRMDDVVFSSWW
jgi:5-formyltetrahydrofolate cyclo-ligase